MTVSTTYSPLSFSGNGATTDFSVTWQFFDGTLVVTAIDADGVETVKTITTHYTVSGGTDSDGLPATGTVTMLTAPASGTSLRISRTTPKTQSSTWDDSDSFPEATIEAALDRLTLFAQEVAALDGSGDPQVRHPYLELVEQDSAPSAPSDGYWRVYVKESDGYLYYQGTDGVEVNLSSQSAAAATAAATATAAASTATTAAAAAAPSFKWTYDTSTTMADPGAGDIRFDSATLSSVTTIAISDNSADTSNPDVSAFVLTWDDSTNSANRGTLTIRKVSAPQTYVIFAVSGATSDHSGWSELTVTYITHSGSFSSADELFVVFSRTGNAGTSGAGTGDMLASIYDAASVSEQLVGLTASQTLTNKTLTSPVINSPDLGADSVDAITEVAAALKSGADGTFVTGTAGTDGNLVKWNSDGDAVDASVAVADVLVSTDIGSSVQAYDADTLKADTADTLTAGYAATPYNAGTKSTGTFTPDEANGNFQYAVNGGAHTLAPPTNNCTVIVQYTNNASAGAITTSGFTIETGDGFDTTNGHNFFAYITKLNGFSHLHVTALQ